MNLPIPVEGESWEQALLASREFHLLSKQDLARVLKRAKVLDSAPNEPPQETPFLAIDDLCPEAATREKIRRDAEQWPVDVVTTPVRKAMPRALENQPLPATPPQIKRGSRGGRYTEDQTKDGRPYRRYL